MFFKERGYEVNWNVEGVKAFLFGLLDRLTAEGDFEAIEMKKILKDFIDYWEFYNDKEILVSELRNGVADESLVELYTLGKYSVKRHQCELCGEVFATKPNWYYDRDGNRCILCDFCFENKLKKCVNCGKVGKIVYDNEDKAYCEECILHGVEEIIHEKRKGDGKK